MASLLGLYIPHKAPQDFEGVHAVQLVWPNPNASLSFVGMRHDYSVVKYIIALFYNALNATPAA